MAQEEYMLGRSHSGGGSGGGCRSKKTKQKKAPQRGLGVAQLEKIISEEKQKKGYFGKNADGDTPFVALHHPTISIYPNSDVYVSQSGGGGLGQESQIWPKSWNHHREYNNNNNNNNNNNFGSMSDNMIAFGSQVYDESNGPILAHRSHQFQRPSSPPLVKYSSGISTMQMEPPSIPTLHFKNDALTQENRMIGMMKKRPYPFSPDHSRPIISSSKSDELALFTNDQQQYTHHMEPTNKLIRQSVSKPETNLNEVSSNSERLNGNFLTLAPPAVASPPVKKHAPDYFGRIELSDNQSIPSQEYDTKSQIDRAGPSGSLRNCFSFFPVELRTNQNTACESSGDREKGEAIDLNLKL